MYSDTEGISKVQIAQVQDHRMTMLIGIDRYGCVLRLRHVPASPFLQEQLLEPGFVVFEFFGFAGEGDLTELDGIDAVAYLVTENCPQETD